METNLIIYAILLLAISVLGSFIAKFFKPGPFLISAQSFASGSFISLALLHFVPDSFIKLGPDHQNIFIGIAAATYALFTLLEHIPVKNSHNSYNDSINGSEASTRDFSQFLVHHFSTIPTISMMVIVYIFLAINSLFLGITLSISYNKVTFIIAALVAKLVEAFTLGLLLQSAQAKPIWFWVAIIIYSLITPLTGMFVPDFGPVVSGGFAAGSFGFFLYIGMLLWRATFLLPFDWKRSELVVVCSSFVVAVLIEAITKAF